MPFDFSQGGEAPLTSTRYGYRFTMAVAGGGVMTWEGKGYATPDEAASDLGENLPWIAAQLPKRPRWAFWREEPTLPAPKDHVYSYTVALRGLEY